MNSAEPPNAQPTGNAFCVSARFTHHAADAWFFFRCEANIIRAVLHFIRVTYFLISIEMLIRPHFIVVVVEKRRQKIREYKGETGRVKGWLWMEQTGCKSIMASIKHHVHKTIALYQLMSCLTYFVAKLKSNWSLWIYPPSSPEYLITICGGMTASPIVLMARA